MMERGVAGFDYPEQCVEHCYVRSRHVNQWGLILIRTRITQSYWVIFLSELEYSQDLVV